MNWKTIAILCIVLVLLAAVAKAALSGFKKPLKQWKITSSYGNRYHPVSGEYHFHNGIDLRASVGTPIVAPANGVIKSIYENSAGGLQMLIEHNNGYTTGYAHLSKTHKKEGQKVLKGQLVAETGNTGTSTGPHLHFTVRNPSGNYVNPENIFG